MNYVKFGFVLIVMLGILCGAHYYLARCIYHFTQHFFPKLRIIHVIIILGFFTVMMFLSIARPFDSIPQRIISVIGTFWMGLFVYLLLYFLASDLICLLVRLIPDTPQKLMLYTRMGAAVLAVVTVIYGFIHANNIKTVNYDVQLNNQTTSQMNVVLLSDLHLGAVNSEARLKKTVDSINAQNPQLVCIAGDIFDNDYSAIINPDDVVNTLKQISAPYGVYACFGNHDSGTEYSQMTKLLERADIKLLKEEYAVIENKLILAGRLDSSPIGSYKGETRQEISKVLSGVDDKLPVIVLDHNPANLEKYQGEADLILSGHTHKGQIFPANLITDAMYTVDYGYYKVKDGTQIIVTSGASTWGLPIRVGTDCEIVNINLEF